MIRHSADPSWQLLTAARSLIGAPFRLHGRDPATGLDCVGLVLASLAAINRPAPPLSGYSRHWLDTQAMDTCAAVSGLSAVSAPVQSGDVLLARVSPVQWHLLIAASAATAVHAHAGLGRVVQSPLPADWLLCRQWRLSLPK